MIGHVSLACLFLGGLAEALGNGLGSGIYLPPNGFPFGGNPPGGNGSGELDSSSSDSDSDSFESGSGGIYGSGWFGGQGRGSGGLADSSDDEVADCNQVQMFSLMATGQCKNVPDCASCIETKKRAHPNCRMAKQANGKRELLYDAYDKALENVCSNGGGNGNGGNGQGKDSKDSQSGELSESSYSPSGEPTESESGDGEGDEKKGRGKSKKFERGPKGPKKRMQVGLKFKKRLDSVQKKAAEDAQKESILASLPNGGDGFEVTVTIQEESAAQRRMRRRLQDPNGDFVYVMIVEIFKSEDYTGDEVDLEAIVVEDVTQALEAAQTTLQSSGLDFEIDETTLTLESVEAEFEDLQEDTPSAGTVAAKSVALAIGALAAGALF